jgi:hypothetical protein
VPKRSNDFQRLVRRIYSQTRTRGAVVTESVMVTPTGSGKPREVDILIEGHVNDVAIRVAVECRDHKRPATIEWIDGLIGKYCNLPIDRVIAVSRCGFTKEALQKAASNQIQTRSLREALETEWPETLLEPFFARVTVDVKIVAFVPYSTPSWPGNSLPTAVWIEGRSIDLDEYLREMIEGLRRSVGPAIAGDVGTTFKRMSDFDRKLDLTFKIQTPGTVFLSPSETRHSTSETYVRCHVQLGWVDVPVKRQIFGDVGVTTGIDSTVEQGPVTLTIAQAPGERLPLPIISYPGEPDDEPAEQ